MKGLYQKAGSDWWYYQPPTPKGPKGMRMKRPKPMALKTTDEIEAINLVTDLQWSGEELSAETRGTLTEILPLYYTAKSEDRKKTKLGRYHTLEAFKKEVGNRKLTHINREVILEWRAELAGRGLSTTTMTSYLIVVRAFFNWCVEEKLLRKNPAGNLGKQSTVRKTRRDEFHTVEEREALFAQPCKDYLGLILYAGLFHGLRIGEMLVMQPEWFYIAPDLSHGSIRVQPTKIQLEDDSWVLWEPKTARGVRTIPLHPRFIKFLNNYGMRRPFMIAPDHPKFPTDDKQSLRFDPKKSLHAHALRCGIAKTNYHMLRHSFGTHLAMGGVPIAEIAGLMGITITVAEETYAGYSPRKGHQVLPGL